jgi:PilZ domain
MLYGIREEGTIQIPQPSHSIFKRSAASVPTSQIVLSSQRVPPKMIAERRDEVRYSLRLPVIFHWNDGREKMQGGFTCDVARDGALIFSTRCPPIGSDVRVEILIPSPDRSDTELRVQCNGKVTRVVKEAGCFGVQGIFDDGLFKHQAMID